MIGLPKYLVQRLQRIQNTSARILTLTKKYDHVSQILRKLHWLPVNKRIAFKILTLVFRCKRNLAPGYLRDLLIDYIPSRNLRSSTEQLLSVPKIKTKSYGSRSFCYAAPCLWNSIPLEIRTLETYEEFKTKLKTYLFDHELGN